MFHDAGEQPGTPEAPRVKAAGREIEIVVRPPLYDGGVQLSNYVLQCR